MIGRKQLVGLLAGVYSLATGNLRPVVGVCTEWNGAGTRRKEIALKDSGRPSIVVFSLSVLLLSGCNVETHKDGKSDNVSIGTPFGSVKVKTNENVSTASIGISQYPGSVVYQDKDKDKDTDSADVNMSFGSFHLGVKAASYETPDSRDKVLAFYRNDLKRYGEVLQCQENAAVGKPDRTSQGLTCDENDRGKHGRVESGSDLELRAGSPQRQHIVGLESRDGGTRIGLVALELPQQMHTHSDKDIE